MNGYFASRVLHPTGLLVRVYGGCVLLVGLTVLSTRARPERDRLALVRVDDARVWHVEVADTPERRAKGLARRACIERDGLLLVFPPGSRPAIWMRDMEFSLDLVWLDEKGTVLLVLPNTPPCTDDNCPVYEPTAELTARYVLELAAGTAGRVGTTAGVRLGLTFR